MADFSAFRLSCGDALLSKATISNLTPAREFLRVGDVGDELVAACSWFCPTGGERARQRVDEGDLDGLRG